MLNLPEPGHFLELLLATLHGQVLSLIQTVLQVLDCDLQVLLHPLQHFLLPELHHPPHPGPGRSQTPASSWCSEGWCSEYLRKLVIINIS
uniref:Si:ch211-158m24.12 n=1 Tax=Stegastes partitus TaxID=144197 RepID=A0A3B4Z6Y6_9TELE